MATEAALLDAIQRIAKLEEELNRIKEHANHKKKSILDVKAFISLEVFKGDGWHKWAAKMKSLVGQAFPTAGRKLLSNAEMYKDVVDYDTLENDPDIDVPNNMIIEVAEDLYSALDFVLEGEAHDILRNNRGTEEGNGLEVWRRLKRRFDRQTKSKTMTELGKVLNPEAAKTIGDVPKEIEKWEERVHRLSAGSDEHNITEDMMTAIIFQICPKRLKDYVELHCNIDEEKSCRQVKDEIVRVPNHHFHCLGQSKQGERCTMKPCN